MFNSRVFTSLSIVKLLLADNIWMPANSLIFTIRVDMNSLRNTDLLIFGNRRAGVFLIGIQVLAATLSKIWNIRLTVIETLKPECIRRTFCVIKAGSLPVENMAVMLVEGLSCYRETASCWPGSRPVTHKRRPVKDLVSLLLPVLTCFYTHRGCIVPYTIRDLAIRWNHISHKANLP